MPVDPVATGTEASELAARLESARLLIDAHLFGPVKSQPAVQHVEYDAELRRWYVRFGCDGRDAATIYFDLHQRTLRYELYFIPAPEEAERRNELNAWVLKRNHDLYGARFSTGPDGDIYLTGRLALEHLSETELDRIIGVLFELTERWFQAAVQIAFRQRSQAAQ